MTADEQVDQQRLEEEHEDFGGNVVLRSAGSILLAVGAVGAGVLLLILAAWLLGAPEPTDTGVLEVVGLWVLLAIVVGLVLRRLGRPRQQDWETPFE